MAENEEELKSFLIKVKQRSEKAGLKLNIKKTKITASSPIASWQTKGEKVETVAYFIFLGSKLTVDSDCSHEIKRCLLLGGKKKSHDNPQQYIKKQSHHFTDEGQYSQRYGFSSSRVWM